MKVLLPHKIIKHVCITWLILTFYFMHNYGLADNGDFSRTMGVISSNATGVNLDKTVWNVETQDLRYFSYWLPYWQLAWFGKTLFSSTQFLWLPGAAINQLFYSKEILLAPALSLFPKFLLFLVLLYFFKWTDTFPNYRLLLSLGMGVPLTLVLSNSSYIAYLNSFYQDTGSFIYLFLFLISLVGLYQLPNLRRFIICLGFMILLSTVRQGNFYWPITTVPIVGITIMGEKYLKPKDVMALGLLVLIITSLISVLYSRSQKANWSINQYNSLFLGILKFSEHPYEHINRLGLVDFVGCIGESPFVHPGQDCFNALKNRLSFFKVVDIIYHEPKALLREVVFISSNMQDITIEYLGKYSIFDPQFTPREKSAVNQRYLGQKEKTLPNMWAIIKYRFFPVGNFLLVFLLLEFLVFYYARISTSFLVQELSLIGLITTIATIVDMGVTIVTGGVIEVIRHLLLANLLFDVSLITFFTLNLIFFKSFIHFVTHQHKHMYKS